MKLILLNCGGMLNHMQKKELSKRGALVKTCTDMKVSADMRDLIGLTIKYTRLSQGEEAAEAQAEEITQVLTSGKPQKEIEDKLWEIARRRG